ncbi:MAG TPA: riboflavin synthase [Burkholderiaceae bacterium]|nr:riboflavin synthase [Burkholderiaceae bacterium]
MFTGIVTAIGTIIDARPLGAGRSFGMRLTIETPAGYLHGTALGDSIALNGACMTVTYLDPSGHRFDVDISAESLARTTGIDRPGRVNLELALRVGDHLGGHLVSGHVDGVGSVAGVEPAGESTELRLRCPKELARLIAVKGSLVVNGVSLTVNRVVDDAKGCVVAINLIPHTLAHTTLGELGPGSAVNVEVDLIARYIERQLAVAASGTPLHPDGV